MDKNQTQEFKRRAAKIFNAAGIVISCEEYQNMEIADFGLDDFERIGLSIVVYIHCDRYSAEEMVLLPNQICPEHRHPPVFGPLGKQETFRCRYGEVYLYVAGPGSRGAMRASIPEGREAGFTVFHEVILHPGEQYTIPPDTLHWFQAGREGAVVSEFSSPACDEKDVFTDPQIVR